MAVDRPGPIHVSAVVVERMIGNDYGFNSVVNVARVLREVMTKDAAISLNKVLRETMVSQLSGEQTQARIVNSFMQATMMARPKMALPGNVRSLISIVTYREQVVSARAVAPMRSDEFVATFVEAATLGRFALPPSRTYSVTQIGEYVEQILLSRNRAYVPISMVYVVRDVEQVLQHRDTVRAPAVRSTIRTVGLVEQVVQSRVREAVVITTYAYANTLSQQVVQQDLRPAPHSMTRAASLTELVMQQYEPLPPGSDTRVQTLVESVIARYTPAAYIGVEMVKQIAQQAMVRRETVVTRSTTVARSLREMTLMARDTYPPKFALGRLAGSLREQILLKRNKRGIQSVSEVGSARIMFMLRRTTQRPIDVIDPAIGRHVYSLGMLTIQHRNTVPPGVVARESRYVSSLAEVAILGDKFPLPDTPEPARPDQFVYQVVEQAVALDLNGWSPVSPVTVRQVTTATVIGDAEGWVDATIPVSAVSLYSIARALALGDAFPDPFTLAGDVNVSSVGQAVALGDTTMPNSLQPASDAQVASVTEFAVVRDAQLPNPMMPQSEVRSSNVGMIAAVRDPSLIGQFGMSEIESQAVIEFAIIRDPTMRRIPLRGGPRPVVTVSMS